MVDPYGGSIVDYEECYNDLAKLIKDNCEEILYYDFKQLIFNPSVYA